MRQTSSANTVAVHEGRSSRAREEQRDRYEQRAPNLQEMDEQQAQHFLTMLLSNLNLEKEYHLRHQTTT